MSNSGYFSPFAPGAYSIGGNTIFTNGQPAVTGLEGLAEDGNASGYANVFNTPNGAGSPGPIFPSGSYSFTFSANETDNLSFALMLVQSNDWFVGADPINLF
ncbi:spondin domain-containing protein [Lacinutrix sp.]|uniref:spondin domain-containing protein n=1 Tax=Lacinutrix sp. TaxID=1937692 RepID=UPI0035C84E40